MIMRIFNPLTLPNGTSILNRIAKAAMEENMADLNQAPSEALMRLYQAWADGGAGLATADHLRIWISAGKCHGNERVKRAGQRHCVDPGWHH